MRYGAFNYITKPFSNDELLLSIQNAAEPVANLVRECPKWDGLPLTLDVSATFPEGAAVRIITASKLR